MTSGAGRLPTVRCGARGLPADRAAVLAVVTPSPDPCSDRGVGYPDQVAMATVDRVAHEGADILEVRAAGDTRQVVSFVAAVRERYPKLVISVATRRREVARAVLEAGADILNGAGVDLTLAEVGCAVVCRYTGCASRRVRVPTPDVGKDRLDGLELLRYSGDLVATGWPVLMTLPTRDFLSAGVDDRGEGILAATAIAAWAGVRVVRARQVRQTHRVLEMVASIAGTRPPARAVRGLTLRAGMRGSV